eukprot:scaffold1469_cov19-Tisochrysis_lutea.AAC.1
MGERKVRVLMGRGKLLQHGHHITVKAAWYAFWSGPTQAVACIPMCFSSIEATHSHDHAHTILLTTPLTKNAQVLNKYYPPDFDPAEMPKRKRPKTNDMKVRMMLPMTVQCRTCGHFMYKGTKFNTRKEDVLGQDYLGIQIEKRSKRPEAAVLPSKHG